MTRDIEEFICTVDLHQLRSGSLWPVMRVLAPHFVEKIELGRSMRQLWRRTTGRSYASCLMPTQVAYRRNTSLTCMESTLTATLRG